MLPYANPDLFKTDSVSKQLNISFTGGSFTNSVILAESFEMTDSICSGEQIEFGECISTMVKFQVRVDDIWESMLGKVLTISITPDGGLAVPLGVFKVASDEPSADLKVRTITAYDAISDIFNTELATWYEGLFPNEGDTLTCKQFRDSLFTYLGITQETTTLINDDVVIEKTITTTSLSGKDVLYCICQLNGVFGKIGRDGKFKYVSLELIGDEPLYPSETLYPADDLYPISGDGTPPEEIPSGTYISCKYENYDVDSIDKVQIRMEENDIGCIVGSGDNAFIIENNFLLFGKSTEDLTPIATAIYNKISGIVFRPVQATLVGNPLREVGDGIRLVTTYVTIDTYVLTRKLKGIQSLVDTITAESTKHRDENITDIHHDLMMLMGKSNVLERTIEETQSTITNVAEGLQTQITQNAEAITGKASKEDGSTGFAYKLTSEKFELINQEEGEEPFTVFKCDKNGIVVRGTSNTSVLEATFIKGSFAELDFSLTVGGKLIPGSQTLTMGSIEIKNPMFSPIKIGSRDYQQKVLSNTSLGYVFTNSVYWTYSAAAGGYVASSMPAMTAASACKISTTSYRSLYVLGCEDY